MSNLSLLVRISVHAHVKSDLQHQCPFCVVVSAGPSLPKVSHLRSLFICISIHARIKGDLQRRCPFCTVYFISVHTHVKGDLQCWCPFSAVVLYLTVSNREPQSSWWLQVPIRELPFRNHFRNHFQNFPALFWTRKYWSSRKYRKCYDCIRLTLLSSSSYSIYYYTLKLSSRIITTILYKRTSAHSIYTFTLVTNTLVVFAHLRQRLR